MSNVTLYLMNFHYLLGRMISGLNLKDVCSHIGRLFPCLLLNYNLHGKWKHDHPFFKLFIQTSTQTLFCGIPLIVCVNSLFLSDNSRVVLCKSSSSVFSAIISCLKLNWLFDKQIMSSEVTLGLFVFCFAVFIFLVRVSLDFCLLLCSIGKKIKSQDRQLEILSEISRKKSGYLRYIPYIKIWYTIKNNSAAQIMDFLFVLFYFWLFLPLISS